VIKSTQTVGHTSFRVERKEHGQKGKPTMNSNIRCAHCNSTVRDCITHYIDDDGNLWRVPTKVCTNVECLTKQGATVTRAFKKEGEYPPLVAAGTLPLVSKLGAEMDNLESL